MSFRPRHECRSPAQMFNARTRFWTGVAITGSLWLAMLLFGGLGWDQDEALRLILYAGDNRVLARNADLLTDFGSWRILVPITIVAAVYLALTLRIRAALLLFTVSSEARRVGQECVCKCRSRWSTYH